jgi:hypothetical protein
MPTGTPPSHQVRFYYPPCSCATIQPLPNGCRLRIPQHVRLVAQPLRIPPPYTCPTGHPLHPTIGLPAARSFAYPTYTHCPTGGSSHSTPCPFSRSAVRALPPNPCPSGAVWAIHNRSVICSVARIPPPNPCPTGHPYVSTRCVFKSSNRTKTHILYKPETFPYAPSWCILTTTSR